MLDHQIKHFLQQNYMLALNHPFNKLQDLMDYHLMENNVML